MAITSVAVARMTPRGAIGAGRIHDDAERAQEEQHRNEVRRPESVGSALGGRDAHALPGGKGHQEVRRSAHRLSSGVPDDVCTRRDPQQVDAVACGKEQQAAPRVHQRRPGRQPRTAKTATTMADEDQSPIGYAMFVATLVPKLPVFAWMIGPMHQVASSAATPSAAIRPSTQMVFDDVRHGLADQQADARGTPSG